MIQLILHLIGDYLTQTDWMAKNKRKAWEPAWAHAFIYSVPFLLIGSERSFFVIVFHFLIDRYGLARYVVFCKNWITNPGLKWADCSATGYHKDDPAWLTVWLLILADNTLHLTINFLALKYL